MIAAFEGWNDAADAATNAIEHLEREWQARPFAAIDPEDYYDYQVNRPTVRLGDAPVHPDVVAQRDSDPWVACSAVWCSAVRRTTVRPARAHASWNTDTTPVGPS
jgi:hypothetical protein